MESMLRIEDIDGNTLAPSFWVNSRVDMVGFVILTRWLLKRVHFLAFLVHEMNMNCKVEQKVEGWNTKIEKTMKMEVEEEKKTKD